MEKAYIIGSSLAACIILYMMEQFFTVDYMSKTVAKLILFTFIPLIYLKLVKKSGIKDGLNLRGVDASTLKSGLILGMLSFAVIIAAYFALKGYIDFNGIALELQSKSKVTPSNFICVGLYITLGNSFLEEFFFRGFIFLSLLNQGSKILAYIYSSLLFGLYHIAIFKTWFDPLLMGFALFGLITIGIVFDRLDTRTGSFVNSWIVHVLADSAIIIIGMRMFGMI